MMRYATAGDPLKPMSEPPMDLVLHFIRSTALDFYRRWVAGGKAIPVEEAGKLLADLTCYGISNQMAVDYHEL